MYHGNNYQDTQNLGDMWDWLKKTGITPEKVMGVAQVIAPERVARLQQRAAQIAARTGVEVVKEKLTTQIQEAASNPMVWLAVGGLGLLLIMKR